MEDERHHLCTKSIGSGAYVLWGRNCPVLYSMDLKYNAKYDSNLFRLYKDMFDFLTRILTLSKDLF